MESKNPYIINIVPREYQLKIFETTKNNNTLVVLPTGLGKTLIALLLTIERKNLFPQSKILFLAPTRPLIEQHFHYFKSHLPDLFADLQLFTGSVPANKRKEIWQTAEIIFSTPQCVANDLENSLYDLKEISLLIIDEAHRCLKNYDYTKVVAHYKKNALNQRILGLTASPGHDSEKIKQICEHLDIEEIELRSRDSPDVIQYLQILEFEKVEVPFPKEFEELRTLLKRIWNNNVDKIKSIFPNLSPINKITLLALQKNLSFQIARGNHSAYLGISLIAQAIKISHALELLETQTLSGLYNYLQSLIKQAQEKKSKAVQSLVKSPEFNAALISLNNLRSMNKEHPKIDAVISLTKQEFIQNTNSKIIIFTQFRETAHLIVKSLSSLPSIKPSIFIGQAKKTSTGGMSQKQQKEIIEKFRSGDINALIATSIHPDEYIVIKNDERISLKKIGEFVDSFLEKGELSKKINGYETLTTDGKGIFFAPITHIHKHHSKLNCSQVSLNSGLDTIITQDHSLFSFEKNKDFVPTIPEISKFVALSLKCPNIENNAVIDVFEEIKNEGNFNLFGSINGLDQAKMRILKTNLYVLQVIKQKKRNISEIANLSRKDYSTVMNCINRLEKEGYLIKQKELRNFKTISLITSKGLKFLSFLEWFFRNLKYKKGKYRFKLSKDNKKEFSEFFEQNLNVNYGKTKIPGKIIINEEVAKFLGFYVSEGHAKKTKHTSGIFLAARKKEMQDLMEKSVKDGLRLKTRRNWKGIAIDSQIAYYLIKDIFKAGIGAYNKEIPEIIFTSPSSVKLAFLEAYCLGDGHISENRIVLTTVSRKLIIGLVLLLRMLGIEKITLHKQKHIYKLNIYESLPFAKIKEKNEKRRHSYFSLVPQAINSEKVFEKYKNYYKYDKNTSQKCRKVSKWDSDICFDFIKKIDKLNNQPEFVYDMSIKETQNFLGGTGLFVLHNSIAEEGLDIPEVNAVIFYEPIPSAIRKIQRAGRTARLSPGKLIILITQDTRDVAHHYASGARERKMHRSIQAIKEELKLKNEMEKKENQEKSKVETLDKF